MKDSEKERIKLQANLLNGLAIATYAIGFLAPVVTAVYGTATQGDRLTIAIGAVICFAVTFALHKVASRSLGGLDDD